MTPYAPAAQDDHLLSDSLSAKSKAGKSQTQCIYFYSLICQHTAKKFFNSQSPAALLPCRNFQTIP
jgi:hypothetical protein